MAVELALTVPVRQSSMAPYLHYISRPLVHAMRSNNDLLSQGIRTIELCVDGLSQEALDNFLEPIKVDLMDSLFKHVRANNAYSSSCVKILGLLCGM